MIRMTLCAGALGVCWLFSSSPLACVIMIAAAQTLSYLILLILNVVAIQRLRAGASGRARVAAVGYSGR
jgi:hypothetical protein